MDAAASASLQAAFDCGAPSLSLVVRRQVYTVDFVTMQQRNTATAYVRDLACDCPPGATWEWDAGHGYQTFNASTSDFIEAALSNGYTATAFRIQHNRYTVDLRRMVQRNDATGFERKIRRSAAVLPPPAPGPAAPAAAPPPAPKRRRSEEADDGASAAAMTDVTERARADELACPICLEDFSEEKALQLNVCGLTSLHPFHAECIGEWLKSGAGRCPSCTKTVGVRMGTQPRGRMTDSIETFALPGYPATSRTRVVTYVFDSGLQGPEHPNPGLAYAGTHRRAYLPSPQGDAHFQALKVAFERRLCFSVGRSVTTGQENCVVWGGLHHKTSVGGGPERHGFPDETFLERLADELKANGVELEE
ncbi:hypothetical protein M885DRAFT_559691 [Pelagophyceae sp. CCMP2097]|nr:hypothetical protein M885DRAFT_559691 [Pelagophyceae sp. CCMP2097]